MKVQRAYKLKVFGNTTKTDTAKYCADRFRNYINGYLGHLFFNGNKNFSTEGLGQLANQAQYKAKGIIKAQIESKKETGNKTNVPEFKKLCCPCTIEKSKSKTFDYWIKVSNQWAKAGVVRLPVKSHKAFNNALKDGWEASRYGEFFEKNGKYYVLVFVSKEVEKATPKENTLGCDVGINKSVTRSDEHKGVSLKPIIKSFKESQTERHRQRTKFKQNIKNSPKVKTYVKQVLDSEAKKAVRRSKDFQATLAVESRKTLNNLRSGKLSLWARNYFANRCEVLCKENEVFFIEVNPYKSSQICSYCGHDGHRDGEIFVCNNSICEMRLISVDADVNAAKVISQRGRQVIMEKIIPKWQSGGRNSMVKHDA